MATNEPHEHARREAFAEIPGARELIDWFGFVPHFHDAEMFDIDLSSSRSGQLKIRAFRMTAQVDDQGYFILDRHVVVTLTLESISEISLSDFHLPGIIGDLVVVRSGDEFRVEWDASYGVAGRIAAARVRFDFEACPVERTPLTATHPV
ncbi:hypothetical protein [Aminobacter aminovorans]|nr:hypothetical protein [Aminobacter aminovorans]